MHAPYEVPRIAVRDTAPAAVDADLVIVPIAQDQLTHAVAAFDDAVGGELSSAIDRGEFKGKACETCVLASRGWKAPRVVFIGGGARASIDAERFRRLAATSAYLSRQFRRGRVAWADVEPGTLSAAARIEIVVEGLTLGNFDNGAHKSKPDGRFLITDATIISNEPGSAGAASTGSMFGESVNAARALVNEPGNHLTPTVFADRAAAFASVPGVAAEILDERRIKELGMGLLLGVARGSAEPPKLLVLRYEPAGAPKATLGLVGKGITFDTGGISIKPADGMERMKDDMAGGAAVACAMHAIARLGAPIRVIGIVPTTENMPGGKAMKPGDILKSADGKTVEVLNTDAEGRLILGDGLWYARKLGATHLVDVATLTGAIVVALGKWTSGLFGTPPWWVDRVRRVADRAGERVWPLPMPEDYFDQLKSEIADFTNTGGRPA
ncbi:MAG: leucyl aminopeptidase, partial [Vicinamibacterales bacterium]